MPPTRRAALAGAVALWLALLASRAPGQAIDPAPPSDPKPPATNGVKEVKPQVFYLKDKNGNLLPVPDMSLEEFKRLYDLSQGLKVATPAYSLGKLAIDGRVVDGKAELDVDLDLVVTEETAGWIRIPLKFNGVVLREPPQHEGEGEIFLDFEPEGDGYVCWLRAKEDSAHKLHCRFVAKVQELGAESRLPLVAPRATSGVLTLRVPEAQAAARAIRRTDEPALDVTADGAGSKIEMLGPAGEFQLAWRAGAGASPQARQTLVARGALTVKLEGRRRIFTQARLNVQAYGAPLEAFTVRLPPGMRLASLEPAGAQLTVLEPEVDPVTQKQMQLVEVRLAAKATGPVDVTLAAEYLRESGADAPVEVGGFEVLDAIKQWGTIDLVAEGEQSAIWIEGPNVRRTEDAAPEDARLKTLARFEYDAQPFGLQTQVVPRRTRVTVEPQYVVYVENGQLRLDATLKYKVRGVKAYNVEYDFSGWTVDRVGPEPLVQTESLLMERTSPLSIPLSAAALPATGDFELKITAHRDLDADTPQVAFDVPRPVAGSSTSGSLVVVPADNIELATRAADMQGLVSDPLPTTIKLPPRQQTPLFFRELGSSTPARYAADLQVRERIVSAVATGTVEIEAARALVEQRFALSISYEPLRSIELDVSRPLWEAGQIQVLLDGAALPVLLLPGGAAQPAARARVRVDLLADRIGRLELVVRSTQPLAEMKDEPIPLAIALAQPVLDGVALKTAATLELQPSDALEVAPRDTAWASSPSAGNSGAMQLTHASGAAELALQAQAQRSAASALVTIERAWVQTWLTRSERQDRAVFRITTAADRLRIRLPAQVREEGLVAAINGRRVPRYLLDADGVLSLDLPGGAAENAYVIELWYVFAAGRPATGNMQLTPPKLEVAGEAQRSYWQLVLPPSEHLLAGPNNLAPDMRWRWEQTHFGRAGRFSQAELEQWIGASIQAELPNSANTYLYSSFGSLAPIELRTAARRSVLLACSGALLVAGLVLLYLPLARHPLVLLAGGIGIAAVGLSNPDAAVVAAQGALAGLGCLLLAKLLKSLYGRAPATFTVTRSPSPSHHDAKSTEPHALRAEPLSQATTAVAVTPVAVGETPP